MLNNESRPKWREAIATWRERKGLAYLLMQSGSTSLTNCTSWTRILLGMDNK